VGVSDYNVKDHKKVQSACEGALLFMHAFESQLQNICQRRPLGLLFDIDGTLSPIAPTPAEAYLHPAVRPLLEEARKWAHIAIITGRAIESGAAMVGVEGLTYIGTHGLEWSDGLPSHHSVQIVSEALSSVEPGNRLLDMAEKELADQPGILIERKRIGGAIHYRLSPDPEQAREHILSLLEQPVQQSGLHLSEGKRMFEIRPAFAIDKGKALLRFVERFAVQGAMFAGDDRTDLDAMLALKRLRAQGIETLAVTVQHHDTLPVLLEQADILVQEVEGMAELLREIVDLLHKQH
jgi:trehalose 6-phosphate phosphatase